LRDIGYTRTFIARVYSAGRATGQGHSCASEIDFADRTAVLDLSLVVSTAARGRRKHRQQFTAGAPASIGKE